MLSSLFGLLSAITWGVGDFAGSLVSRRAGIYRAAFYGEFTGVIFLFVLLAVVREPLPAWSTLGWSLGAGVVGSLGVLLFFRAMIVGKMSIVAPVSALMVAILPVIASALTEGLPGLTKYFGFALALVAIWLISREDDHPENLHVRLADLQLSLLSGVCFGVYFILLHQGSLTATIWPLIAARATGVIILLVCAIANRQVHWPGNQIAPLVLLYAAGDVAGNAFYVLAGQVGRLDVAAVLSSLYPGTTVLLAGIFLHERLNRFQWIGILAALVAILLMTV